MREFETEPKERHSSGDLAGPREDGGLLDSWLLPGGEGPIPGGRNFTSSWVPQLASPWSGTNPLWASGSFASQQQFLLLWVVMKKK